MSPEQYAEAGTEHAHQVALFIWVANVMREGKWPELKWLYAIPNGGGRSPVQGAKLKAEGVKPGVSDLCLPAPRRGYCGLYIEMKKPGSLKNESKEQKEFGEFVTLQGYLYRCVDHWEHARDTISWYME